jgi:hypothetical protein
VDTAKPLPAVLAEIDRVVDELLAGGA